MFTSNRLASLMPRAPQLAFVLLIAAACLAGCNHKHFDRDDHDNGRHSDHDRDHDRDHDHDHDHDNDRR